MLLRAGAALQLNGKTKQLITGVGLCQTAYMKLYL